MLKKNKKVELLVECDECNGTGLYSGMAEGKGCAVICARCGGTGKRIVSHTLFWKRKIKRGIKRVFKSAFGYGHTFKDITTDEGKTVLFSKGGCTYKEWLEGIKPKPVTELYCPFLWSDQKIRDEKNPGRPFWKERCEQGLTYSMISDCKHYRNKSECWKRYFELGLK